MSPRSSGKRLGLCQGLTTAYDQAAALATNLASVPMPTITGARGHSTERIACFLKAAQLTGDDEQYAATMALMACQLRLPARVVMGFYPPASTTADPIALTGRGRARPGRSGVTPDVAGLRPDSRPRPAAEGPQTGSPRR